MVDHQSPRPLSLSSLFRQGCTTPPTSRTLVVPQPWVSNLTIRPSSLAPCLTSLSIYGHTTLNTPDVV